MLPHYDHFFQLFSYLVGTTFGWVRPTFHLDSSVPAFSYPNNHTFIPHLKKSNNNSYFENLYYLLVCKKMLNSVTLFQDNSSLTWIFQLYFQRISLYWFYIPMKFELLFSLINSEHPHMPYICINFFSP